MKLREAEVFGLNHKFAVNAAQCDIANPVPSELFPLSAQAKSTARDGQKFTVPEPFSLQTGLRGEQKKARLTKDSQASDNAPTRLANYSFPTEPEPVSVNPTTETPHEAISIQAWPDSHRGIISDPGHRVNSISAEKSSGSADFVMPTLEQRRQQHKLSIEDYYAHFGNQLQQ